MRRACLREAGPTHIKDIALAEARRGQDQMFVLARGLILYKSDWNLFAEAAISCCRVDVGA
jgi:hypothetical protein